MQWFSAKDLGLLAKLPFSAAIASCVPETRWDGLAELVIRAGTVVNRSSVKDAAAVLARHVDRAALGDPIEVVARRYLRNVRIDGLATVRSYDPRGWRAVTAIKGLERITAAQAAGRGVILWVAPFIFAGLVTKRALHAAGIPLHHLSTSTHGSASRSHFGINYIRLIRVNLENRYLAERVVIPLSGSMHQPLRRLKTLLGQRAVVSVTVGSMGAQPECAPFLRGQIRAATGVPSLARRTGAVILPVVTVRMAPTAFTTFIDAPIETGAAASPSGGRAAIVHELARRLEPFAHRWPDQVCWDHGLFGPSRQGRSGPLDDVD